MAILHENRSNSYTRYQLHLFATLSMFTSSASRHVNKKKFAFAIKIKFR